MAYSDFTISKVETDFGLTIKIKKGLFREIEPRPISENLKKTLNYNIPLANSIDSEKARSEMIVVPILLELKHQKEDEMSLFSGVNFDVDKSKGLKGICDFLLSKSSQQLEPTAPVVVLIEAKRQDFRKALPQCVAEMFAAKIFNERKNLDIPIIYGVITIGTIWQFLKLENQSVEASSEEYTIEDVEKIFGILWNMVS
jgi:hypothetical protein